MLNLYECELIRLIIAFVRILFCVVTVALNIKTMAIFLYRDSSHKTVCNGTYRNDPKFSDIKALALPQTVWNQIRFAFIFTVCHSVRIFSITMIKAHSSIIRLITAIFRVSELF